MGIKETMVQFEERVALLLQRTDKMRGYIEAHEFSLAAAQARELYMDCTSANVMANRIADEDQA